MKKEPCGNKAPKDDYVCLDVVDSNRVVIKRNLKEFVNFP